jgi:ubiquitin-protein ligase
MTAVAQLQKQLKELHSAPLGGFRVEVADDIFQWTVWFLGPADSHYYPGVYKALMTFPKDFPMNPPEFRIVSAFWHPNVYANGVVCISILHPPGAGDEESAMMRWLPIHSVRSVLVSVVSLLSDPDPKEAGAPANVDALVHFRKDRAGYAAKCAQLASKALAELPPGFQPIPKEDARPAIAIERGISFLDGDDDDYDDDVGGGETGDDQHPYAAELEQLRSMGMGGERPDAELLELIAKHKGDLSVVMEYL